MDVNKIFLSSTVSQAVNSIISSNLTNTSAKINKLNSMANWYTDQLNNYESVYDNAMDNLQADNPNFDYVKFVSSHPNLLASINDINRDISTINNEINSLEDTESNEEEKDGWKEKISDAIPLGVYGAQKIKEFYARHSNNNKNDRNNHSPSGDAPSDKQESIKRQRPVNDDDDDDDNIHTKRNSSRVRSLADDDDDDDDVHESGWDRFTGGISKAWNTVKSGFTNKVAPAFRKVGSRIKSGWDDDAEPDIKSGWDDDAEPWFEDAWDDAEQGGDNDGEAAVEGDLDI